METFESYSHLLGIKPTAENLKKLTTSQANTIYKKGFWDQIKASKINNKNVTHLLYDMSVNSGPPAAVRKIQKTLKII